MNVIGMILERRETLPSVKDTAQLSGEASTGGHLSQSDLMWHLFHVESGRWITLVLTFSSLLTAQSALNHTSHSLIHTPSHTQPSGDVLSFPRRHQHMDRRSPELNS